MTRDQRSDYLFLLISLLSLFVGLLLSSQGLELASKIAWAVGALIGLGLAIGWVVRAIRQHELGSDSLAVIAILATAVTDEWLAASVISVMLATGRALERWAEGRARKQLKALLERAPQTAHRIREGDQVEEISVDEISVGDRLLVRSGEVVPIDGELLTEATLDESALTGEPLPVWHQSREEIASGVLNSGSALELKAVRTSNESTYANLIRLVRKAEANTARGVRIANKWAVRFVPFAIAFALLTWLITGDPDRAVAVIVAATPCPLILAVPVALISGMSKAAARGAIIKGGAALEQLARSETILLDKTGTLTHGGPVISEIVTAPGVDANRVLTLAASLELQSPHVVARAIVAAAHHRDLSTLPATDVHELHGSGIRGRVDGVEVAVGQPSQPHPSWAPLTNALLVEVKVDGEIHAIIGLDDPVREESASTIQQMKKLGVKRFLLVSGDRQATATAVGAEVGVDEVYAEFSPEQKLALVHTEKAKTKGAVVAVGDGINDAPALTAADVGVAMGARGSTAASEAADVVIVEDSIFHLAIAIDVAKGARARALQASGIGMGLAIVAMTAGALGYLDATGSAVAQEFIDAAAILWALVPARSHIHRVAKAKFLRNQTIST